VARAQAFCTSTASPAANALKVAAAKAIAVTSDFNFMRDPSRLKGQDDQGLQIKWAVALIDKSPIAIISIAIRELTSASLVD
jgi:hypothetical protein